jgi:hypothetical protein
MTKTTKAPKIAIQWRDENNGSVSAVAAFRIYSLTSDWSERTKSKFRGCLKRAGFSFHDGRCAYIAVEGEDRQLALCNELAAAGFHITNGDVRANA